MEIIKLRKILILKTMLRLLHAYQKSITFLSTIMNIYLLPTFHLLEYNNDYSMTMTSRTLWKYHRLKLSNDDNHINSVINSN